MSDKILVAYATRTRSTAEIAQAISATLAENGSQVEVRPIQEVTDLEPYRAIVLGSPIHDKKWLPEAIEFVRQNQAALSEKPFAAFMVCMALTMKNQNYHQMAVEWLAPVRRLVEPVSEGFFAGVLDIESVSSALHQSIFRVSVWTGVWAEGDHRNWEAIRAWASDLSDKLQAPKP
ncbi:MAG: flavodoxin [Chloroflexota bacterium]|nr:flavodoxin [Chloroflexota bacterium]NOG64001.1 flavodoxin [Chloroflexota bacterium]GIK65696.1 MAG: flavodoxin [Chloroflexota bacterium]